MKNMWEKEAGRGWRGKDKPEREREKTRKRKEASGRDPVSNPWISKCTTKKLGGHVNLFQKFFIYSTLLYTPLFFLIYSVSQKKTISLAKLSNNHDISKFIASWNPLLQNWTSSSSKLSITYNQWVTIWTQSLSYTSPVNTVHSFPVFSFSLVCNTLQMSMDFYPRQH